MSQTSNERLRTYLAQLAPQAQALLMREFERAVERGDDPAVAGLVLGELRKIVRGVDDDAKPRTDESMRLVFAPLEPFLADGNTAIRPGQIRRASLAPIWLWLTRDGAPDASANLNAALRTASSETDDSVRQFQIAATEAIAALTAQAASSDQKRTLARIGPALVTDDLVSVGTVLKASDALETFGTRLPLQMRTFTDSQIASVMAAMNVPALQPPLLAPFVMAVIMMRLTAPWQIIRIAIKSAASDDEYRVAATPYGGAVTMALHDLSRVAASLREDIRRGQFANVGDYLKTVHDGVRGLRTELDIRNDSVWGRHLAALRVEMSNTLQSEIDSVPGRVRRLLRQRPDRDVSANTRLDAIEVD